MAYTRQQLALGRRVEMEHASTIKRIERQHPPVSVDATWIAQDHLREFHGKPYYPRLLAMERQLKKR